ncbi:hypothetical protein [Bryobacter aggregatus]|uniref:hypothetical protein n=1 Tax=Bryobacter aggregatus TaxID=360054 RepID=UPI00068C2AE6|nr:hypothetical protein [Bryobacter aggregatus]
MQTYQARVEVERKHYDTCDDVHQLPAIFHYWSNRYLKQRLERLGFDGPNGMFLQSLKRQATQGAQSFVSIGSGNCDLEVELALGLQKAGFNDFTMECLNLNPVMLERGKQAARVAGVAEQLRFVEADFNYWDPNAGYKARHPHPRRVSSRHGIRRTPTP